MTNCRGCESDLGGGSIDGKLLVKGITIAYDDVGEGENVLVLVHGHPFNRTMWRPQVEWIPDLSPNVLVLGILGWQYLQLVLRIGLNLSHETVMLLRSRTSTKERR
jgi:hypothetical protein